MDQNMLWIFHDPLLKVLFSELACRLKHLLDSDILRLSLVFFEGLDLLQQVRSEINLLLAVEQQGWECADSELRAERTIAKNMGKCNGIPKISC
jgi:hypothetical protein